MDGYQLAWIIVVSAAVLGALCFWFLLRPVASKTIKILLITAAVLFFVTPAQVPQAPEVLAPAFVVAAFEAWFQIDGKPVAALLSLGIAIAVGVLLAAVACFLIQRRRQ